MRFRSAAVLAALTGAGLFLGLRRDAPAADASQNLLDIFGGFNNRVVKAHTVPPPSPLDETPIGKVYRSIVPGRSILFYDCKQAGCDQDYLTFHSVLTLAANAVKSDPDTLYQGWYNGVIKKEMDPQLKSFANEKYQLLAVANRMDMAYWDTADSEWKGAEIHFAYGPVPTGGVIPLTVILEFVLAADPVKGGIGATDFQTLAQSWNKLSASTSYSTDLRETLRDSGLPYQAGDKCWIRLVRVRTNFNVEGGNWRLTQMVLDPAKSKAFAPALLDDQLKLPVDPAAFLDLWKTADYAIQHPAKPLQVPDKLLEPTCGLTYNDNDPVLGTPPGLCGANPDIRNALALQRCTGCHTNETHNIVQNLPISTRTQFAHIPNRAAGGNSTLSGFLVGPRNDSGLETAIKPDLTKLYAGDPSVVWTAVVPYQTYPGVSSCLTAAPSTQPATLLFHDIARRMLFLAAVLSESPAFHGPPTAQNFSTHSIE